MSDTPNYNESTVAGTSWTRSMSIHIDNPYGALPSIVFLEEKIYVLADGKIIKEQVGNLSEVFNPELSAHQMIYNLINSEYVRLREIRDTPVVIPEPIIPPVDPPVDPPVEPTP